MARKPVSEQGDTLKRIREQAFLMFGRYGFDGVSMLTVAKAAGITKAALYWHFDSKEALFLDGQRQLHQLFNHHVLGRMGSVNDSGQQLCEMFYGVVDLLRDERIRNGVAGYWLGSSSLNTNAAIQAHRRFEQASIDAVESVMQRAIDAGIMHTDIPCNDMARVTVAIWEGIVLPLRVEPFEVIERLILTMGKTYFRAHRADALAKQLNQSSG
ncbi:MAG: TetR/AcrR family transcriptional regulator [Oceanococcus sp.]